MSKEMRKKLYLSPSRTKVIIPFDYLSHYRHLFWKSEICLDASVIKEQN